jgi:uroporphyrinogen-III synthase
MPRRVLITREIAEPLRGLLEAAGLQVVHVPLVLLQPTGRRAPMSSPAFVVVSSAAVVRFVPDLALRLRGVPIVAVGAATAGALEAIGLQATWVGESGGEALLGLLPDPAAPLWYIGALQPSVGVRAALDRHGGPVEHWAVYENHTPAGATEALAEVGAVDLVVLTSPSAASRYAAMSGDTAVPAAVIGEATARAARDAGLQVCAQPEVPGTEALAAAVVAALV